MEAIARTFKQLWSTKKGFEVKDMGNHVVLFVFSDKTDANKVLLGEPWSYDKYLVSLCRLEKNSAVKDLVFDRTAFWVQLHDIPVSDMTPEAAAEIGKVCGDVLPGIRDWGNQDGSTFMRIRVRVDTSKPLCRGRKLRREDGEIGWIRFKYERLSILCYWYGKLSYSDKDCELWIRSNGSLTENDRQFGAWLRAPLFNTRKCSVIRVGGEVEDSNGGADLEEDGEKDEVLGRRRRYGSSSEHVGNHHQREEVRAQVVARKETGAKSVTVFTRAGVDAVRESCKETDFKDMLRGIDTAISKFDDAKVDSELSGSVSTLGQTKAQNQSNMLGPVGCISSGDVEMLQTNGPYANENKSRGWKRLVIEQAHAEIQITPLQRKRHVRDDENETEVGVTGKKFCTMDTIQEQTAKAAGQPRREQ